MRVRKAALAWDVRSQLRPWTRISVACMDKKGCVFDKLCGRVLHSLGVRTERDFGNTQITRIIGRPDNESVKSKRESSNGEELGREIRNFLSKNIAVRLAVENPKLDARKTSQIWDRESHFWVICPKLSFCPFIQPRQLLNCRNISGENDVDRKCRGASYVGPGGNIKQFPEE